MRRKHGKPAILATSLLAGCGTPAQLETRQNVVEPAQKDPGAQASLALAADALHHDRFARRELYTWTTTEQIEELRRSNQLLVRDESPVNGASYLDQVLYLLAQRGEPVAKLLYTTAFAKMRFAWHAPWATRDGWPNEKYGDQLIRIRLKADAVIVALSTATGAFEAKNLLNETVPLASVLASPEKIAAIYFVSEAQRDPAPGLPRATASFRELALCNESMIESWEVGTDTIAHVLAQNAAAIDAMVRYLSTKPAATPPPTPPLPYGTPPSVHIQEALITQVWAKATPRRDFPGRAESAYAAALALDSPMYQLDPTILGGLELRLRRTPKPRAFEGRPTAGFVAGGVRKPPRIVKSRYNSYASFSVPPSPTAAKP